MSELDAMKRIAPLFARIRLPSPDAAARYDMLSDAIIWSDELPSDSPEQWWDIRPGLRHRTCLILGVESPFQTFWEHALNCFPG